MACAMLLGARLAGAADGAARGALPPLWERLEERLPRDLRLLESLRPLVPEAVPAARRVARCRARLGAASAACVRGRSPGPIGCAAIFRQSAEALATRLGTAPPDAPVAEAAEAAARLAFLFRAVARARRVGCAAPTTDPTDDVPAVVTRVPGGAALRVAPARALAPHARYWLRAELPAPVVAVEPPLTSEGTLAAAAPAAGEPLPPRARDFVADTLAGAARAPGVTVHPSLVLHLARPLSWGALRADRVRFTRAPGPGAVARLTTGGRVLVRDARRARAAGRKTARAGTLRLLAPDGPESVALGIPAGALPHVARLAVGRFVSHDLAHARSSRVRFVIALPRAVTAPPPVLLLHGLHGTGLAFFLNRADLLAEQGLAAVGFDLPGHGARTDDAVFFTPTDPARLARGLRQATVDAIALATALGAAPLVAHLSTGAPRLLGYSLGGMVGTLVLGAVPELGAAVLVAPAGDLADWLGLHVAQGLGVPILACAGGADAGAACLATRRCPPGGACVASPGFYALERAATAYGTVLAEVDPQTWAARAAGPDRRRPVLVQEGADDEVIENGNTAWLATALGADMTCRLDAAAPQTLCRFPGVGHNLVNLPAPRAQAHRFLASAGRELGADAAALAAR